MKLDNRALRSLPDAVEVVVEVPAGSRLKRRPDGTIAFVSPLPAPFNYGSVPATTAPDGDPLDALVLGPPLPLGSRARWPVHGVVRFRDAGQVDDKLICGVRPPTHAEQRRLSRFFTLYAVTKRLLHRMARRPRPTAYLGTELR